MIFLDILAKEIDLKLIKKFKLLKDKAALSQEGQ